MLNDGTQSAPALSLHPHMAWLADNLIDAGLMQNPTDLLSASGPDTKTFFLKVPDTAGKEAPSGGLVVRFMSGANAVAKEWPGEAAFFETLPNRDFPAPVVRAVFRDRHAGRACVVLTDLRASHRRAWDMATDTAADWRELARTLGRVHAEWWPAQGLRGGGRSPFGMEALVQRDRAVVTRAADLLSRMGHLNRDMVDWVEMQLDGAVAAKLSRWMAGAPVTRVHGTPSLGILWHPKDPAADRTRLTDWDDWRVDLWAGDIARLLMDNTSGGLSLQDVLPAYRDGLVAAGIDDYPPEEMTRDVRACLPFEVAVGILQGRATAARTVHWRALADAAV
ncbi:MAG: hypothetical protein VX464_17935 [Pseudomonadota bacterium]|nr:hypothetical protein [Pseudomonadota bacterium]